MSVISKMRVLFCVPGHAQSAQTYPSRPVRFIIPAGTADHVANLIAAPLTEQMGRPFILDNRPGAGGIIAAELLAHAAADGHTLGMIYTSYTTNAVLRAQAGYSPTPDQFRAFIGNDMVKWTRVLKAANIRVD
jgi:tripartite-type tricarboxylate transporter receptor subunit TctC